MNFLRWSHAKFRIQRGHRPTTDIGLFAKMFNQINNITEIAGLTRDEDGITFDTQQLILRNT